MQNARFPMYVAIAQNIVNIAVSLLLVIGAGLKVEGVAAGTLVAQYAGFLLAVGLWWRRYRGLSVRTPFSCGLWHRAALLCFLGVNRDIFPTDPVPRERHNLFHGGRRGAGRSCARRQYVAYAVFRRILLLYGRLCLRRRGPWRLLCRRRVACRFQAAYAPSFQDQAVAVLLFSAVYVAGGRHFLYLFTDNTAVVAVAATYCPSSASYPSSARRRFFSTGST